jgi:hypothetical protein
MPKLTMQKGTTPTSKAQPSKPKQDEKQKDTTDLTLDGLSLESNTSMTRGKVVHRRSSQYIGDVLVEELPSSSEGCIVRRMRFMSNLDLEQTEARLMTKKLEGGKTELVADSNYLPYMW